jgi:hypothetical protein
LKSSQPTNTAIKRISGSAYPLRKSTFAGGACGGSGDLQAGSMAADAARSFPKEWFALVRRSHARGDTVSSQLRASHGRVPSGIYQPNGVNIMRTIFAIAVVSAALASTAALASEPVSASGSQGTYCLKEFAQGEKDCSFKSLAECNATASGLDAECYAAEPQTTVRESGAYALHPRGAGAEPKRSDRPVEPR